MPSTRQRSGAASDLIVHRHFARMPMHVRLDFRFRWWLQPRASPIWHMLAIGQITAR